MIYAKHNFAENFMNVDGETFALDRDMIISELARVINANPVGVKDAIFDCGINIDPQADKFEISEVMSGNMANNDCLQRSIGHLVLDNNVGLISLVKNMKINVISHGVKIKLMFLIFMSDMISQKVKVVH